uniref:soluble epoxide hydrolase n=2 Tax=Cajanus cajan TaxID=3821 RepID=A0A151TVT6_CAJCA|nr:Epoxide hydrolase 2 [Cajanus cajan]
MNQDTVAVDLAGIKHRRVEVNGIKMHVAEKGEGPVVLLLHGFPELWYSWRYQIEALSSLGYRAVAPDLRGYGDTEAPTSISNYTVFHIVGDIVALIDSLGVDQVYLVAHDWGAIIAWYLSLFRPERVKAYVCLSVPFLRRDPNIRTVDGLRASYGDDYYICRFQKPGQMEAQMAQVGTEYVINNMLTSRQTGPPILPKGEFGTGFNPNMTDTLPSWLTQDDLHYYVSKFQKTGFTPALNYYRNMNLNWELLPPWSGVKIQTHVKFITGELDSVYTTSYFRNYIDSGDFKEDVPNLEQVIVLKDVAHFNNQEAADQVNDHIYNFIKKF